MTSALTTFVCGVNARLGMMPLMGIPISTNLPTHPNGRLYQQLIYDVFQFPVVEFCCPVSFLKDDCIKQSWSKEFGEPKCIPQGNPNSQIAVCGKSFTKALPIPFFWDWLNDIPCTNEQNYKLIKVISRASSAMFVRERMSNEIDSSSFVLKIRFRWNAQNECVVVISA